MVNSGLETGNQLPCPSLGLVNASRFGSFDFGK